MFDIDESECLEGSTSTEREVRSLRVLVAEDDDGLRAYLSRSLGFCGYDVIEVSSGYELDRLLRDWCLADRAHSPADVLVTDLRMPGLRDMELLERILLPEWTIPTVVVSAVPSNVLEEAPVQKKNVLLLRKPIWLPDLERSIRRAWLR